MKWRYVPDSIGSREDKRVDTVSTRLTALKNRSDLESLAVQLTVDYKWSMRETSLGRLGLQR